MIFGKLANCQKKGSPPGVRVLVACKYQLIFMSCFLFLSEVYVRSIPLRIPQMEAPDVYHYTGIQWHTSASDSHSKKKSVYIQIYRSFLFFFQFCSYVWESTSDYTFLYSKKNTLTLEEYTGYMGADGHIWHVLQEHSRSKGRMLISVKI